jgi:ACS family tartrate transporter-like MFS transporter
MSDALGRRTRAKVARRIIPFVFLLYIFNFLDRVNVGYAKLEMNADLGFSETVYALGAGVFFVGYVIFEVPSNLILQRVGARVWIARIMITWGIIAAAMALVDGAVTFYVLRFLLGFAEAGFFPGIILYLTYWFTAAERARAVAGFMTALAAASIFGSLVSAVFLGMEGILGLEGWQWLFILEGVPTVLIGIGVLFYLTDRPEKAHWLEPEECAWLVNRLESERERKVRARDYRLRDIFITPKVLALSLTYFCLATGFYGIALWLPSIIQSFSGLDNVKTSLVSAIPYLAAGIAMVVIGRHSDRTGERKWHVAGPLLLAAAGFVLSTVLENPVLEIAALCLVTIGVFSALGPFWTMPTAFLAGSAAAGGLALINSIGNIGGFVSPMIVGHIKDTTGDYGYGLLALAGFLIVGAVIAVLLPHDRRLEAPEGAE